MGLLLICLIADVPPPNEVTFLRVMFSTTYEHVFPQQHKALENVTLYENNTKRLLHSGAKIGSHW